MKNEPLLRYQEWLEKSTGWVKDDLESMHGLPSKEFEVQLQQRFGVFADFGTGGLRQIIRAGTNGFNDPWVTKTCLGLSKTAKSVVIAYDTRRRSRYFAMLAAKVLASRNVKVFLFDEPTPTPVLSFAVRYMKCTSGIVITASHNKPMYNGLKVYDLRGVQMVPDQIVALKKNIDGFGFFEPVSDIYSYDFVGKEIKNAYFEKVIQENERYDTITEHPMKIVYTPIHGTGVFYLPALLKKMGFDCELVDAQKNPDPEFSTVSYPNPEDPEVFTLSIQQASAQTPKPEMLLATDPDADRLGIYLLSENTYHRLTGNEIGILLMDFLIRKTVTPGRGTVLKTIVTTDLAQLIANKNHLNVIETLTGFKFLGDQIEKLQPAALPFICAFEESYGFLHGDHARDKDALSSALLFGLLLKEEGNGRNILKRLENLGKEYGFFQENPINIEFEGVEGIQKIQRFMTYLRAHSLDEVFKLPIQETKDYLLEEGIMNADVFRITFSERAKAIFRPSGTESKLKIYLSIKADTAEKAFETYTDLRHHILAGNETISKAC